MTVEAIGYIGRIITGLDIPYEFDEWTSDLSFPYFVGEYTEIPNPHEDGKEEGTFILTGMSDDLLKLEKIKDSVKKFFKYSQTFVMESGGCIAVTYESKLDIPTGVEGLHRMQINLNVKEWSV